MSELLQLTPEEMEHVENRVRALFPEHDQLLIIHEKESKYCHSDLGILFTSNKESKLPVILFTIGCSATKINLGGFEHSFELIYKLPRNAFAEDMSEENCELCGRNPKTTIDLIAPEYRYVIEDMIKMSKLPAVTSEYYDSGHTIEINSGRIVGLLSFSNKDHKDEFQLYHIIYLNKKQFKKISATKDMMNRQIVLADILKYNEAYINK